MIRLFFYFLFILFMGCSNGLDTETVYSQKTKQWYRGEDLREMAENGGKITIANGRIIVELVGDVTTKEDDKTVVFGGSIYSITGKQLLEAVYGKRKARRCYE